MVAQIFAPRLLDIVEASERLQELLRGLKLEEFEADWKLQWLVERGVEIISEASRHLPDDFKANHPDIPWRNVAGIGNVLRHNYEHVSPPLLYTLIQTKLGELEAACRAELEKSP
ncbi:DUF86 domain-containing protein [Hyphomicrobium sp.]|jgi:uncharacterized protein with HEPN domain|uniref:HepT-like ribonuclease domain-containing protein n=1 Tax=Hyphomicrobium sp. TaxID=82 RepID=UPI0035636DD1